MRMLAPERLELIDALVAEAEIGDISAGLLEKDEHLTTALQTVFGLRFEFATLVFCGGTSLSKAHGLIERMSEDADIKVVLAPETEAWSRTRLRRYLGDEVRGQVFRALTDIGLAELAGGLTLPLLYGALSPTITRPFYAVPRTSVVRTAWG